MTCLRKLWISILSSGFLLVGVAFAGSGGMEVDDTSVCIIPRASQKSLVNTWVTNTAYSVGVYTVANRNTFLCIGAGTSAATGTGPAGSGDITDGTATWRSALARPRKRVVIMNISSNPLCRAYLSCKPALMESGIMIGAEGCSFEDAGDNISQEPYYCIVTNGPAIITTDER